MLICRSSPHCNFLSELFAKLFSWTRSHSSSGWKWICVAFLFWAKLGSWRLWTAYRPKQFDGKSQFFSVYEIYLCTNTSNHHTQYLQMLKTLHAHSNILRCWLLSSIITHLATKNPMCGEAKQRQAMFGYLASIAIAQSWGPSFHSSATSFSWLIWWQISTTLLDQTCKIKMWLVKFQSQRPVYNYCLPNHVGFGSPCACNTQTHVYTYVFAHVPPK